MELQEKIEMLRSLVEIDTSQPQNIEVAMGVVRDFVAKKDLFCEPIANSRAWLIQTEPTKKMKVGFVLHIDVVPAMGWEEAFSLVERDGKLYGRGVADDKGPLVVCLAAILRLRDELPEHNFGVLVVSDEESTNEDIHEVLGQDAFRPELAVVVDGGAYDMIDIGEKGTLELELVFETSGGHSGFEQAGDNAALVARKFLDELEKIAENEPVDEDFSRTFVNISRFEAVESPYGMPSRCRLNLELQFPLPQTSEWWKEAVLKLAEKYSAKMHVEWANEPHVLTDERILKFLRSLSGVKLETIGGHGLSKDLDGAGIAAICHCPVDEYSAHCVNENIGVADLDKGEKFYVELVKKYVESD